MQRTITYFVRLVTIIAIVVYYDGSCYCAAEDRPLTQSWDLRTSLFGGKKYELSAVPSQNETAKKKLFALKCCADGQVFRYLIDIKNIECVPFDNETYSFEDRLKRLILSQETNESSSFVGISYRKRCQGNDFVIYPNGTFTLHDGGSRVDYQTDWVNGSTSNFCIEFIANENRLVPLVCEMGDYERFVLMALMGSTLGMMMIGYLKTLFGKLLFCHATSLAIGYMFLNFSQMSLLYETYTSRFITAIGMRFFILAGFFWLNVMCFDIWRSFRTAYNHTMADQPDEPMDLTDLPLPSRSNVLMEAQDAAVNISNQRPPNESAIREARRQFIRYSLYAWGCPIIITSTMLLAEFWPKMSIVFPHPHLADYPYEFRDKVSSAFYFHGPMGIVLLLNGVIFCAIFKIYIKNWRSSRISSNNPETSRHAHREQRRSSTCLLLFIVMGVCWTMEVILWFVVDPKYTWQVTDICNIMQGFAIILVNLYYKGYVCGVTVT